MFKVDKVMVVVMVVVIGVSSVFVGGSQDGVIYFMGVIVEVGFCVQLVQWLIGEENVLQVCVFVVGDQVVLEFYLLVMCVVLVDVLVEVCVVLLFKFLCVGDVCGKVDVLVKYGGFKVNLLMVNNGMLILLWVLGVEFVFVVVMLFYQ